LFFYLIASVGAQSSGSEKMLQKKSQVLPSFQSIKSLPVDFRFVGSPTSEQSENANLVNSNTACLSVPEKNDLENGLVEGAEDSVGNDVNEDSPYSQAAILVEQRPSVGDEDLDTVPTPLPLVSTFHRERRWADTSSYAAKKVLCMNGISFCYDYAQSFAAEDA
jgi:myosin-5